MTPIKCEYCGANNAGELECVKCGAPLPLRHSPLRGVIIERAFDCPAASDETFQVMATDGVFLPRKDFITWKH